MELIDLKNSIRSFFSGTESEWGTILETLEADQSVFPFNKYEHLISTLINRGDLAYEQYIEIRTEYISRNPNLYIFEISAPRLFADECTQYIKDKCLNLQNPSTKLDPTYRGTYSLWLDGVAIGVNSSRVVDKNSREPLYMKALSRDTEKKFLMNFQQLKPQFCDVFVWLAIFRDEIVIWVMNSSEVLNNPLYSKGQHRGNLGNEGQLHIKENNIHLLNEYELKEGDDLEDAIHKAFFRK